MFVNYTDHRVTLLATADMIVQAGYRFTPFLIFNYRVNKKAYYIFGRRIKP